MFPVMHDEGLTGTADGLLYALAAAFDGLIQQLEKVPRFRQNVMVIAAQSLRGLLHRWMALLELHTEQILRRVVHLIRIVVEVTCDIPQQEIVTELERLGLYGLVGKNADEGLQVAVLFEQAFQDLRRIVPARHLRRRSLAPCGSRASFRGGRITIHCFILTNGPSPLPSGSVRRCG